MSEVIEVELKDGTEDLVDVPEQIDALTKKKMLQMLNVKTRIKNGETEHEIDDSGSKAFEIMDLLVKRALRDSEINHNDLTEDSKMDVARVMQEELEQMGMDVKKKENRINGYGRLIAKGHNPNIDDRQIRRAADLMNDLEAGAQIPLKEIPARQWLLMKMLKSSINKEKQRQIKEQANQV